MKVLVFGKNGQVATELAEFDGVTCLGRDQVDLTDPGACEAIIASTDANAVINAAAYTNVDGAEEDRGTVMIINAIAPTAMATAAAKRGIPFVHISSDYVFDGAGNEPFTPIDIPSPQNIYGKSKHAGEHGVVSAAGAYAVLRTSWVFSAHGTNFLKTMMRIGADRHALRIVADQVGGPTPAKDIAAACMTMAHVLIDNPSAAGLYHISGAPDEIWADFAREFFKEADLDVVVTNILTSEYYTHAKRPLNSRLDCSTTHTVFGIERPDWRVAMRHVIAEVNKT